MKQSPEFDRIQKAMAPGVICRDGFLGTDTRQLIEILIDDDADVKRLGTTHEAIAGRMRQLRDEGMKGLGEFVKVPPHFEARVDSVRGKLPCPFGHPGIIPKTNITVRNMESGGEITYTDMNIHLIEAHGFYEGRGACFRLEPADLLRILQDI
ncbi:hypothetical protein JW926_08875 [Candidatus Sumerlaeota bacterium]|nr:hypothetical protein [Candidatus Sumerlaeota bacterium]